MQANSFLRVNVVSGLPGAGKSSVTRAAGAAPIPLGHAPDALPALLEQAPQATETTQTTDVFVEAHPSIGPLEIASSLLGSTVAAAGSAPYRPLRLGDLVTVLDASRFWSDLRTEAPAPHRWARHASATTDAPLGDSGTTHDDPDRTTGDALVEQIEWASVVVINKIDLAGRAASEDIRDFVRLLNPASHVVFTRYGRGAPESWPEPRRDMYAWLQRSPGWVRQLNGDALIARSALGLGCVVYRDPRPFHPGRLADFFGERAAATGEILRSRGLFRLATRTAVVGSWNSAGPTISLEPTAMDGTDPESPWGQEIAFFGRNLDPALLTTNLDACLLSDQEFLAGPSLWQTLDDPFPGWETETAA